MASTGDSDCAKAKDQSSSSDAPASTDAQVKSESVVDPELEAILDSEALTLF